MSKTTPMMQQYQEIKSRNKGAILFFRLGDFYEMFGQDAIEASRILDITLTARNKKSDPIPMCGIPFHAAENYIAKLTRAGKRVAICEQTSDPSLPGIVKRDVVRVVTPGTTYSDQVLDKKSNRYIMSLFPKKDYFGIAFADLTTGEFQAGECQGMDALKTELLRIDPAELVLHVNHYDDPDLRVMLSQVTEVPLSSVELYEEAHSVLTQAFRVNSLDAFGLASQPFAVQAAGILWRYLQETQKDTLTHMNRITAYHRDAWMPLDEATIRNLELFSTLRDGQKIGTLHSVLDETRTPMGARLLRRWIAQPLLDRMAIQARHEAVDELVQQNNLRHSFTDELNQLMDLERLLGRLSGGSGNAKDLVALSQSLERLPHIKNHLEKASAPLLKNMEREMRPLDALTDLIAKAILDEPLMKIREGGMIRRGYHEDLDELHSLMKAGKTALKNIEAEERAATGIESLKVGFNKVFGYYIEITKTHSEKVPESYIRKQTLSNAERYITPELKEFEEKVLGAEDKIKVLEYELFHGVREQVLKHVSTIRKNARLIAQLDVLTSFAITALKRRYVRPELTEKQMLQIEEGRHAVVESMTAEASFIPNSTEFHRGEMDFQLLTGPNMSGKSTYLRQVALIALMSQIGSFVPASAAKLRVFDRIFTRVGASDNLVKGQSTFMVEMQESAYILNHATDRSLIILDEVGRGTSTYDGLSIAWSMVEFIHDHIQAFTLFATHYHELIDLADQLPKAKNYSVDVQETPRGVLFLHKVKEGAIHRSYGIEVAKLAGLPHQLITRAQELLAELETSHHDARPMKQNQMDLFTAGEPQRTLQTHPALDRLKQIDVNEMTPLQALSILDELKRLKAQD